MLVLLWPASLLLLPSILLKLVLLLLLALGLLPVGCG
jgi:hypothetical protein